MASCTYKEYPIISSTDIQRNHVSPEKKNRRIHLQMKTLVGIIQQTYKHNMKPSN
jgi:hypothetical protein